MDMLEINFNNYVFVKLKPAGVERLNEYCDEELEMDFEEVAAQYPTNEEGYTRFQVYELIHIFKYPSDRYISMAARAMHGFTKPLIPALVEEKQRPVTEIKVFDGRKFGFFGDPDIVCKCMSNGRRCNQRELNPIEDNPWIQVGKDGNICGRVWRELPNT